MARGFGWWQNVVVELATGAAQPNAADFRAQMPELFELDMDAFAALYEQVRLR